MVDNVKRIITESNIRSISVQEEASALFIECQLGKYTLKCVIQGEEAPEIDISLGSLKRYRSFGSEEQLYEYLNLLLNDIRLLRKMDTITISRAKILGVPTSRKKIEGLPNPSILG